MTRARAWRRCLQLLPLLCSALHLPGRPPHAGPASEPSASRRQLLIGLGAAVGSAGVCPASLASDVTEWQDPRWESLGLKGTYHVTHIHDMACYTYPCHATPRPFARHSCAFAYHRGCGGGRHHWPDGSLVHVELPLSACHSPRGAGAVGCTWPLRALEGRPCHAEPKVAAPPERRPRPRNVTRVCRLRPQALTLTLISSPAPNSGLYPDPLLRLVGSPVLRSEATGVFDAAVGKVADLRYLLLATCYLLLATCYLLLATCYLLLATCYLLLATCHVLLATRYLGGGHARGGDEEQRHHGAAVRPQAQRAAGLAVPQPG